MPMRYINRLLLTYLLISFITGFLLFLDLTSSLAKLLDTTQARKQTNGDPIGQTWNYRRITLLL